MTTMAEDIAAARKQQEWDVGAGAWEKAEAEKNWLSRQAGELGRGLTRGIRDTAHGAGDLLGDAWEGMGGSPESRDNPVTKQKDQREQVYPYSSGSLLERGSRAVGQAASIPGGFAKAPAKTLGQAAMRGVGMGAAEGLLYTDEDSLKGKLKDAGVGGALGAAGGAAFHVPTKGTAVVSPAAKAADRAMDAELGADRISPRLSLGKKIGDSPDLGSQATAKVAKGLQKGKRARNVKDLDQRAMDDMFMLEAGAAHRGNPRALGKARDAMTETRNWRQAAEQAELSSVINGPPSSQTGRKRQRALTKATQAVPESQHGRFSPRVGKKEGVTGFARMPEALGAHSGTRVPKPAAAAPQHSNVEAVGPVVGGMTGGPMGAVAGSVPIALTSRKIAKHAKQAQQYADQSHEFVSRVADLPEINDPILGKLLTGDADLQKKYKKVTESGLAGSLIDELLAKLAVTGLVGDEGDIENAP